VGRQYDGDDYQYAIDLYLAIIALDPDDTQARSALRACAIKKSQKEGAVSKILLPPLQQRLREDVRKADTNLPKKADLYQRYLLVDPVHSDTRSKLATTLLDQGLVPGATAEAEMALKDDPSNAKAVRVLVKCCLKLGRKDEAKELRNRLDGLKPRRS
jgi:tetratricopeptide (TPR) repeat protein